MRDSERDRIFGDWLEGHKGILFKVGVASLQSTTCSTPFRLLDLLQLAAA